MALSRKTPLKRSGTLSRESSKLSGGGSIKRKQKTQAEKAQQSADIERMWKVFDEHWYKHWIPKGANWGACQCENCGGWIPGENKTLYHHHVLPKAKYPQYKYDIQNLMLLCQDCHSKTENGYPGEEVRKRTEQAHKQFGI